MTYMRSQYDVEFTHDGKEFIAFYTYDADLGRSWITDIQDENGEMIPKEDIQRDGSHMRQVYYVGESDAWAELHPIAKQAMENAETSRAEKAYERALSDGPSESYESIQARNRRDKDGIR